MGLNPNIPSGQLFGESTTADSSAIQLMAIPWEVTTSYGGGTSLGPAAILQASPQLDFFNRYFGDVLHHGLHLELLDRRISGWNSRLRPLAKKIVVDLEENGDLSNECQRYLEEINQASAQLDELVYMKSKELLKNGITPAILGGDHSVPFGLIRALSEAHTVNFGILHIDAHADLRESYQGFKGSHASIMRNVTNLPHSPKLIQVGIRDFCEEEWEVIQQSEKISTFFDSDINKARFSGTSWHETCSSIVSTLPDLVYVSFDIDGLSPDNCPNTGTPVPGGLSFNEALYLIEMLARSGRKIVGFDLVEVAPGGNEWDGNIGARLVYQLCGWTLVSQNKQQLIEA